MIQDDMALPIYYVLSEYDNSNNSFKKYGVDKILKVYACDFSDISYLWDNEVVPLLNEGRQIHARYYTREPGNMFREMAREVPRKQG